MNVSCFPVNPFVENTYILWMCDGGEAAIIDPGMMTDAERDMVAQFVAQHSLRVKYILITHYHIDHVTSANWCKQQYGAQILSSAEDESLGKYVQMQAAHFRLRIDVDAVKADRHLKEGDTLALGDEEIRAIATPGHSSGSLSFYVPQSNFVITGDVLFAGSIGRTDLPGGDYATLISAIRNKLFTLPSDTMVYAGHGPSTSIGDEMRYNPYF